MRLHPLCSSLSLPAQDLTTVSPNQGAYFCHSLHPSYYAKICEAQEEQGSQDLLVELSLQHP